MKLNHIALFFGLVSMTAPAYGNVKDAIYDTATAIQQSVYDSTSAESALYSAQSDLRSALRKIRTGGGGGGGGVYCKRVRNTDYYAPARISDQEWLQDNGTALTQCQDQLSAARFGLICARVRNTDYYAPKLINNKEWRGENGTDAAICTKQTRSARPEIFCQRIRNTDYYAIARIVSGDWMQDNGTSLDECVAALGGFQSGPHQKSISGTPRIPAVDTSATSKTTP